MYTLRKITGERIEFNKLLGKDYVLILFEKSPDKFWDLYVEFFQTKNDKENLKQGDIPNCYGFVQSEGGKEITPLFKDEQNYIMTDSGKTFSNICM